MSATATLVFPRVTPPLLLPASALVIRSNGVQVMVVEPSVGNRPATIHFRNVVVGRDYGGTVEIADGLIDGATVVLNPNADLQDGAKVKVLAAVSTEPTGAVPR